MKKLYTLIWITLMALSLGAELSQSLSGVDSLYIGSRFDLHLKADKNLLKATIPDTLTAFEVIKQEVQKKRGTPDALLLQIIPLKLGALSFPELEILADDGAVYHSDRFRIHVLSVRAEGDTLLRDIKPPQRYPWEADWRLFLGIAALALILLVILIYLLWKRPRKGSETPLSPQIQVPNWKQAWEELTKLLNSGLLESGMILEFHYSLAQIVRRFIESEYGIKAVEMTTYELRNYLQDNQIQFTSDYEVLAFLKSCDLIKFARHEPSKSDIDNLIEWLKAYLIQCSQIKEEENAKVL